MTKTISTDTYMIMQAQMAAGMIIATGGKFDPLHCKAGADVILKGNGIENVIDVHENEETRKKELEKKLSL